MLSVFKFLMEWSGVISPLAALIAGFITGMLVMRNNYRLFTKNEEQFRSLILDKKLNDKQTILKIRNILNV